MKPWLIEPQKLLSRQINNNCLPHAILISGVDGSGKQELAQWLIKVLVCQSPVRQQESQLLHACGQCKTCLLHQSKTYPDHIHVESQTKTIGIDEIRLASRFLEKTAHIGINKTVLIPKAEKMTVAAANALLKTLEEPTDNSVIVLLSCDATSLLPTIISRCRLFNIRPPVGDALLDGLSDVITGNSVKVTDSFINLTHLPELSDPKKQLEFIEFQENLFNYLISGQSSIIKSLSEQAEALRWLEKILVNLMRSQYNWASVFDVDHKLAQSLEHKLKPDTLWQIYQVIVQTNKQIKSYSQINSQFSMEKLFVDIGELTAKTS